LKEKILDQNLEEIIKQIKSDGKKIIFTNGVFDILHPGHVQYLEEAKKFGDVLILGLNSDISVKKLKGSSRPINNWNSRALVLSGLESVDYLVKMEDDTPIQLIQKIKPDIHVKGGDYKNKNIPEEKTVIENGGKVVLASFVKTFSPTNIIKQLKNVPE
jgi:D-glycero-beta-D-manno-heptose 1-phosphate adenylyltransferase